MMLPVPPDEPRASIIIRTYNEAHHLPGVLTRLSRQRMRSFEVIVVDSGSTDSTREVAELAGARVLRIAKEDFTFGRSLNVGCAAARGEFLVFLSGHCYPMHAGWLGEMLAPFANSSIGLVYGKQRGGRPTKYSEHRHFASTFPNRSAVPQDGFFCNNANCAVRRSLWEKRPYDEGLTGLEDLDWARWLVQQGLKTAYTAEAGVHHIHTETWNQVYRRYEREAIALKNILPEFRFTLWDLARLTTYSILLDARHAMRRKRLLANVRQIIAFRSLQYWATYQGAHYHRVLTQRIKEKFFYPR